MPNFYLALLIFIFIIFLSSRFQASSPAEVVKSPMREVSLYSIGSMPQVKVAAQVEKGGVVTMVALSGGVVQKINYKEGDKIEAGSALISLSTNYQGGNASSIQRELANNQYRSVVDTFDLQKSLIENQRNIATISAENSNKIRDDQINTDKPPAKLVELQKDLALKQFDLQEKMLGVNQEASHLQLQLASITEALMFPSAPISGVVQRIFVKEGFVVTPGTTLAVISKSDMFSSVVAVAYVPGEIARQVSRVEKSSLIINEQRQVAALPYFISQEAVQGNSYAVYYAIPVEMTAELTDKGYIDVEIPVGYADMSEAAMYVPVTAVFQTETEAYLFLNEKGVAKVKRVILGGVYGAYVEIRGGLKDGDQVIASRNVVDGDRVESK